MAAPLRAGQFFGEALAESHYSGVSLGLRSYRTGLFLGEHDHERAHFCFVLGGSYEERVRGRNHNRSRDDLMFYPPGTLHSERYLTGCRALLIDVKEATWLHANEGGRIPWDPTDLRRLTGIGIARRICLEMQQNDDVTPLQIEALVMELLVESSRGRRARPQNAFGGRKTLSALIAPIH
jgi:quercetin dioxygenase-like cupin family protein